MRSTNYNNYNVFFPVQIWKHQMTKHFRFQPPLLGFDKDYSFPSHFIDTINMEDFAKKKEYKKDWKLVRLIWGFNPKYYVYSGRGIGWIIIFQEKNQPYASTFSTYYSSINYIPEQTDIDLNNDFIFFYYLFTIPGTELLFVSYDNRSRINDVILIDEEGESDTSNEIYNFLPFRKNKDIPFYDILWFGKHCFMNIYTAKPNELFWKSNSESICFPTSDPNAFPTFLECNYFHVNKTKNRSTYLQDTQRQINDIMTYESFFSRYQLIIFYFCVCIFLLLFLLLIFQ